MSNRKSIATKLRATSVKGFSSMRQTNLRKKVISFAKNQCITFKKRSYSKDSNAERIVKIFRLEAELQLSVYIYISILKQIFVWDLQSIC